MVRSRRCPGQAAQKRPSTLSAIFDQNEKRARRRAGTTPATHSRPTPSDASKTSTRYVALYLLFLCPRFPKILPLVEFSPRSPRSLPAEAGTRKEEGTLERARHLQEKFVLPTFLSGAAGPWTAAACRRFVPERPRQDTQTLTSHYARTGPVLDDSLRMRSCAPLGCARRSASRQAQGALSADQRSGAEGRSPNQPRAPNLGARSERIDDKLETGKLSRECSQIQPSLSR